MQPTLASASDVSPDPLIRRLRTDPTDVAALTGLRSHYLQRSDYASLANLLAGWARRSSDDVTAAEAFHEAAELCRSYLDDSGRAMTLYQQALERNPLHGEATDALERIYEAARDWGGLHRLLEQRVKHLDQIGADPRYRATIHEKLGKLWNRGLGRPDLAVAEYHQAVELDPGALTALYAAREIYRQSGNDSAAATLYEAEAQAETDPVRKIALWRELAYLRFSSLHDLDGALDALAMARAISPTDTSVLHDTGAVLLQRAQAFPDGAWSDQRAAADAFLQIARSVDADRALHYVNTALDAAPGHDEALTFFEELVAPPPDAPSHYNLATVGRWIAYLQANPGGDVADAVRRRLAAAYRRAEQWDDAIACLEPLRHQPEAAEELAQTYHLAGRETEAMQLLAAALPILPEETRRKHARRLLRFKQTLGDHDQAEIFAREILDANPSDDEALEVLSAAYARDGRFDELRDALLRAAEGSGVPANVRVHRLARAARLSSEELNEPERAATLWRTVLELSPDDRQARDQFIEVLEGLGQWEELTAALADAAERVTDPRDRSVLLQRIGSIHIDRRRRPKDAVNVFRQAYQLTPDDSRLRDRLCDALLDSGESAEAVPLLKERIRDAPPHLRVVQLRSLATILEEDLNDDESAFEALTRILDESPRDIESLTRMEEIDRKIGRADRLVEVLGYRSEISRGAEQADIFVEMGPHRRGRALPPGTALMSTILGPSVRFRATRTPSIVSAPFTSKPDCFATSFLFSSAVLSKKKRSTCGPRSTAESHEPFAIRWETRPQRPSRGAGCSRPPRMRKLSGPSPTRRHAPGTTKPDAVTSNGWPLWPRPTRRCRFVSNRRVSSMSLEGATTPRQFSGKRWTAKTPTTFLRFTSSKIWPNATTTGSVRRGFSRFCWMPRTSGSFDCRSHDACLVSTRVTWGTDTLASQALRAWVACDPSDPDPRRRLVNLLETMGEWSAARDAIDGLARIVSDPAEREALADRAARITYEYLGDAERALDCWASAGQAGPPDRLDALMTLARRDRSGRTARHLLSAASPCRIDPERACGPLADRGVGVREHR